MIALRPDNGFRDGIASIDVCERRGEQTTHSLGDASSDHDQTSIFTFGFKLDQTLDIGIVIFNSFME